MIAVIRISGMVNVPKKVEETLFRVRLRRKFSCVILKESEETTKLLNKIRNYVSYGKIQDEVLKELVGKRGVLVDKNGKLDSGKVVKEILSGKELSIKPFFRLHPPRGGIDAKKHFGVSRKAVLGENKEINELIGRML